MNDKHAIFAEEFKERGWIAKFKLPGKAVEIIKGRGGEAEYYPSYAEAMAIAGITLCARLNGAKGPQIFIPRRKPVPQDECAKVFANFK